MEGGQTLSGSLPQGWVSLWMPVLCAHSPGNCAWLFLSPVSSKEPQGVPLPALLFLPGPGFLPLSHPACWVPARGPGAKGGVTQLLCP